MFHKEGHKIILVSFIMVLAGFLLADKFINIQWLQVLVMTILLVFLILILQFFRNPKRHTSFNENHVVSPVDGKVVVID